MIKFLWEYIFFDEKFKLLNIYFFCLNYSLFYQSQAINDLFKFLSIRYIYLNKKHNKGMNSQQIYLDFRNYKLNFFQILVSELMIDNCLSIKFLILNLEQVAPDF